MNRVTIMSFAGIAATWLVAVVVITAGSQGSVLVGGYPLFALCGLFAFSVQWVAFVPAYLRQTEHFFDLAGSVTYISTALLVLALHPDVNARSLLIAILVAAWATRLGSFLFSRIQKAGFDRRFTRMKTIPVQFFMTWNIQGLWVMFTFAAGLAAMTSTTEVPIGPFAIAGTLLWLFGFGFEVVADMQKSLFRSDPANTNQFIRTGLWGYCRHPNYFGEIVLWLGIAVISYPVLSGWQMITLISPLFVFVLLRFISGVRMLEARAEKQWGDDPEYQSYKTGTPALLPRLTPWTPQ